MSKVHDAMRNLERGVPEAVPTGALRNLVGALIGELAQELPDDAKLESVRADLLAASRSFEVSKKEDLALRFYLATRSLINEYELLHERLRKSERERRMQIAEPAAEATPPELPPAATNGN